MMQDKANLLEDMVACRYLTDCFLRGLHFLERPQNFISYHSSYHLLGGALVWQKISIKGVLR